MINYLIKTKNIIDKKLKKLISDVENNYKSQIETLINEKDIVYNKINEWHNGELNCLNGFNNKLDTLIVPNKNNKNYIKDKKTVCNVCNKLFTVEKSLNRHILLHSNDFCTAKTELIHKY